MVRPGNLAVALALAAALYVVPNLCAADGAADAGAKAIEPKGEEVMQGLSKYYASLKSFQVDVVLSIVVDAGGKKKEITSRYAVSMRKPDRAAMILTEGDRGISMVSDGEKLYTYFPRTKTYTVKEAPKSLDELVKMDDASGLMLGGTSAGLSPGAMMSRDPYKAAMADVTKGAYLGLVQEGGKRYHRMKFSQKDYDWEAWVAAGDEPLVWKVAPDLSRMLAEAVKADPNIGKIEMAITFENWAPNADLPDETFKFTPPAGARELDLAALAPPPAGPKQLLGKPAPAFKLSLLDGGEADLSAHKGKNIVVLDFWASWCGPCRRAMPVVVEVADSYKKKGVVLYAVNVQEKPAAIRKFLKDTGLKVTVALDKNGAVAGLFRVRGIPQTVIIGKDGTVQAVHVGALPDLKERLTRELKTLAEGKSLVDEPAGKD